MSRNFVVLITFLFSTLVYSVDSSTEKLTRSIGTQTNATEKYKVIEVSTKKIIPRFDEPYCLKLIKTTLRLFLIKLPYSGLFFAG